MKRASGVLLPVSSLPSKYGIGCFSKEAYKWIDQLKKAGQSYWQILPLAPTSCGDSPYQSFSSFAGNPYFIDLEELIKEGVLTKEECDAVDFGDHPNYIDYGKMYESRYALLRLAYERSNISENYEFNRFVWENGEWLDDYALFMAVKKRFNGASWNEWAEDIKKRWGYAMDYYRRECYYDIEFYKYLQFVFRKQWDKLKKYANDNGIEIIGDIPIYVAYDSADAWASPELFQFDEEGQPAAVAGCPPDGFSADGQLWGNPLYRWDYHKATGYEWWCKRVEHCFKMYDVVRIDHFRAFDEYYSIPYGDKTAVNGEWMPGPGMDLFDTLTETFGEQQIIAEDLGFQTPTVQKLLKDSGYPGMKVLEFAFDPNEMSMYLPHRYDPNCVVYTGTHDNETMVQWYKGQDEETKAFIEEYMNNANTPEEEKYWDFVRLAMMSCANTCVTPIQDILGLDAEARMNHPSTMGNNWKWRVGEEMLTKEASDKLYRLTKISERLSAYSAKREYKKRQEALAAKKAEEAEAKALEEKDTEELAMEANIAENVETVEAPKKKEAAKSKASAGK